MSSVYLYTVLQLESKNMTRVWGLEVDHVELAVEAVLLPPQDSLAGPSWTVPSSSCLFISWGGVFTHWQEVPCPHGQVRSLLQRVGGSAGHSAWCLAKAELCYLLP